MDIVYNITFVLIGLAKFFGLLVLGVGLGWLLVSAQHSERAWQVQVTFLAGLFALLIAMTRFAHSALAGIALGLGIAIFVWGLPKKAKKDDD